MLDENVVNHNEQIQLAVSEQSYTAYKIAVYAENHQDVTYYDFVIKKGELDFSDEEIENQTVVYALDCGDHGVNTTTGNETMGKYNSVTEQIFGIDGKSGCFWGLIDDAEDQYNGSNLSNGLYTANTWCYEFNSLQDGLGKMETNRYTKNQYESGMEPHLDYLFELPDGTYNIELGFADPWGCSTKPTVYAYRGEENEQLLVESFDVKNEVASASVQVQHGFLDLNIVTKDKAINLCYIKITAENVEKINCRLDECTFV